MQVQKTRPGGVADTATTATRRGRLTAGTTKGPQPRSAERHPDIVRLDRWAQIGMAQQRIAHAQAGEQALGQVWGELKRLEQQLGRPRSELGEAVTRLQQLDARLTRPQGPLTPALKPRLLLAASDNRLSYRAERLDLLSPKARGERLVFSFPRSRTAVEVTLPANASSGEVLSCLDQALSKVGIEAQMSERGTLELRISALHKSKLDEPLLISGEGIRIPAGNPVPVQFHPAPGQLTLLAEGLARGEIKPEQLRLTRLLNGTRQSLGELKLFRQQLLAKLDQLKTHSPRLTAPALAQLQTRLTRQLDSDGFGGMIAGLQAQANLSRQSVVALLT